MLDYEYDQDMCLYEKLHKQDIVQACKDRSTDITGIKYHELLEKNKSKEGHKTFYHYIQSVVGDDEITTTDVMLFSFLLIIVGPVVTGVKLSEHDIGISSAMGNYAEEWILTPPTKEASFGGVLNRHKGNGIPYVLDLVKLKALNPVRKQSNIEMDFESKFSLVHETASWVNINWFTSTFHDLSMVLAMTVFEFRAARTFPFLYKTEGGCGGRPPYNNLFTVYAALHHFNGGRAISSILQIMHESTLVHTGKMAPKKGIFLQAMHAAQTMGYENINQISTMLKELKLDTPEGRRILEDALAQRDPLPDELDRHKAVLVPTDYTLGAAVAHLVDKGLVMTEMDVRMLMAQTKKIEALKGTIPMGKVIEMEKLEKLAVRKTSWKMMLDLGKDLNVSRYKGPGPNNWFEIMQSYFTMRMDRSLIRGLSYADMITVYPSYIVRDYFVKTSLSIREDFVASMPVSRGYKASFKSQEEQKLLEESQAWIRSDELSSLLKMAIPVGIGPDDSRILRKICMMITKERQTQRLTFVIVSSDRDMAKDLHEKVCLLYPLKPMDFVTINFEYYVKYFVLLSNRDYPRRYTKYSLPVGKGNVPLTNEIMRQIRRSSKTMTNHSIIKLWDFPNINKKFSSVQMHYQSAKMTIGGFFDTKTAKSLNSHGGYAFQSNDEFNKNSCFNVRKDSYMDLERARYYYSNNFQRDTAGRY